MPKIAADQAENRSAEVFSERTNLLAQRLGVALRDLPPRIGMSMSMLFAYRAGKNRITNKAWAKIRSAEIEAGVISEHQSNYRESGDLPSGAVEEPAAMSPKMIDPRFQPRPQPSSRADVETYLKKYLDAAAASDDPDVFPAIMRQLKKHFPLDEFDSKTP